MLYFPKGCKYHSEWYGENIIFDTFAFKYFPTNVIGNFDLQKIQYTEDIFNTFRPLTKNQEINCTTIGQLYTVLGMLEPVLKISNTASNAEYTVEKAIQMMTKDFRKSMKEYALLCGVSESQFYLYFQSVLKKTPNRVRQEIVCQRAISYLTLTDLTIEEICDKTGFSSASYFRKVFFSVTGKTPSQVRKEHAGTM
ncbi:MAG: helix-turn-helix transcriptional regulator [Clostridia bacterium]|nr:helix-turn-helix transcriptional regulator [Clostridia bacterium]